MTSSPVGSDPYWTGGRTFKKNTNNAIPTGLSGPAIHVLDRPANSHRETSSPRLSAHETYTVASQKQLEGTGNTRKSDPNSRVTAPHLQWWLEEDNMLQGQALHPVKHALQIFADASKEGWGAHLNEHTARGTWCLPESKLHINYLELEAVFLVLKEFEDLCSGKIILVATNNTTLVSYINKEGGMSSGPLCALLWRILTWCTKKQVTLKARHIPGRPNVVADKLSRLSQTIQTEWSSSPFPNNMQQVAPAPNRPICHEVQQVVASVCVTGTGFPGHSSGCTQSAIGGSGRIHLPTSSHTGQSGGEVAKLPIKENHYDCSRVP